MGNAESNISNRRRRHDGGSSGEIDHHTNDGHLQQEQPELTDQSISDHLQQEQPELTDQSISDHLQQQQPELTNQYIYAAAYTSQYPNHLPPHTPYFEYQIGARYLPPPLLTTEPNDDLASVEVLEESRYSCTCTVDVPTTNVDHQKAVTIRYDVYLRKETLKIKADEENPGKFLVSFIFDATVPCSITLSFLTTTEEEDSFPPLTVSFQEGIGQKFRQKPGTGIDLSRFEEAELRQGNQTSVYGLTVKVETTFEDWNNTEYSSVSNSQITEAVFENDKGEYKVILAKQMLWVNGINYELQEIYGIGKSNDGNDSGEECAICLLETRDTIVLPCRHMCLCNVCAKVLRLQTNKCPICMQPVESLLETQVNGGVED